MLCDRAGGGTQRADGRPKLLLPLHGRPLIEHLLSAWRDAGVEQIVAVVRGDDLPLAEQCRRSGACVVTPETPPPDMKASVQHALKRISQDWSPADEDYWLLAPADMPLLRAAELRAVLESCQNAQGRIVVPVYEGKRGHPAGFPWTLAAEALRLPSGQGLNALLKANSVVEVAVESPGVLADIDTPAEYRRLQQE